MRFDQQPAMKNALLAGSLIGLLTGAWLLVLYLIGYVTFLPDVVTLMISGKPFPHQAILFGTALLIPVAGLYLGLSRHKKLKSGTISFREALTVGLKILLAGGIVTGVLTLLLLPAVRGTVSEFIRLVFWAALAGLVAVVILSLLFRTRANKS
jgi:hypothetical protein